MIITLTGANFQDSNIGTLDSWNISRVIGEKATYDGPTSVKKGADLFASIHIDNAYADQYEFDTARFSITMGGVALSTGYTATARNISIGIYGVTGNVVIKAPTKAIAAVEPEEPETATYTFTINPTPSNATVTLNGTVRNSITVASGTSVSWKVEASGYTTQEGTHTVTADYTKDVTLASVEDDGNGDGSTTTETVALVFTEGTLDSITGAEKTATGTYRSDYVAVDASSVVKFTSAKTMIVFKYDSSKKYTGRDATDWYSSSEVPVSDAAYVRILVKGVSAPPTDGTVTRTSSSGGNNGGGSGGSEGLGNTTFGSDETPVTIISDFSGFTFEDGKVVSTSSGSSCKFGTGNARAASTTQILSISGGKTYTFVPTISGLQYALIEFTDAPCTVSTLNKSGQYGQAWSSATSGTIHSNTKYLTINFNRGSGNFSTSELEALKNAIKIN